MNSAELTEHLEQDVGPDTPYRQLLILDYPTDGPSNVFWACNRDGREIDPTYGCPEHAPRDVPGLALVECEADPRHGPMWTLAGEQNDYGNPCPACIYAALAADYAKATKRDRCYHRAWRRSPVVRWLASRAYTLGVISGYSISINCRPAAGSCVYGLRPNLRPRPYVLGVPREVWRCWFRGHRRGEHVGLGYCGKCMPWPCCGSQTSAHIQGCAEAPSRSTSATWAH